MQRVHSRARFEFPPGTWTRTRWRFGMNVRELTLWAWEMLRPKIVFFPQTSQTRAMAITFPDRRNVPRDLQRNAAGS